MLGGKLKDVLYPAAGLEILHNYTLIIDDIIDNSKTRRGQPTCWHKYGRSIAECVGIDYSAAILQATNKAEKKVLISELFARATKKIIEGEILDILFERSGREDEPYVVKNRYREITEKDYFEMISKKTAALFLASCEVGGICAKAKKRQINALRKYGFNYGMIFQITDDILDIFGKEHKFQKKIGKDIEERKEGNAVILCALKELRFGDRKKLLGILRKGKIGKKDIKEAMKLINKTTSQQKSYKLAERFAQKAKNALTTLPQNKWNDILATLVDFTLKREK
jgi:geranylgeranyl pyrophosphate synthase